METISIYEVMEKLNLNDVRAARKWCEKEDVQILKHGKYEFVVTANFKEAFERPFVNKLKSRFGKDWESVYQLYKNGNIPALLSTKDNSSFSRGTYKASNNESELFMRKLTAYGKKTAA